MIAVRSDGVLGSAWAVVSDCGHPEWPSRMVPLPRRNIAPVNVTPHADAKPLIVRAGERVWLWRQDAVARIETSGAAEDGGAEGQRIRVRLTSASYDGTWGKEFVMGIVRGPGSVEILR